MALVFEVERVMVTHPRGYVPTFPWNPLTGATMHGKPGGERVVDGDLIHVVNRDYQTTTTTFLRSFDGGRTWTAYQAQEILRTKRQ